MLSSEAAFKINKKKVSMWVARTKGWKLSLPLSPAVGDDAATARNEVSNLNIRFLMFRTKVMLASGLAGYLQYSIHKLAKRFGIGGLYPTHLGKDLQFSLSLVPCLGSGQTNGAPPLMPHWVLTTVVSQAFRDVPASALQEQPFGF